MSLEVRRGTLYGFLGPNGAGIRMLAGLMRPSGGAAEVAGIDVVRDPLEAKRRIGFVLDEPRLFEKLTAREFLTFVGDVYGLSEDMSHRRSEELLEMFDLENPNRATSPLAGFLLPGCSLGFAILAGLAAALAFFLGLHDRRRRTLCASIPGYAVFSAGAGDLKRLDWEM